MNEYASMTDIAKKLGCSITTVSRHIKNGKVPKSLSKTVRENGRDFTHWHVKKTMEALEKNINPVKSKGKRKGKPLNFEKAEKPAPPKQPDPPDIQEEDPPLDDRDVKKGKKIASTLGLPLDMPISESQRMLGVVKVALAMHDLQEKKKQVRLASEVEEEQGNMAVGVKSLCMAMCDRIAPSLVGIDDVAVVTRMLRAEMKNVLTAISKWEFRATQK